MTSLSQPEMDPQQRIVQLEAQLEEEQKLRQRMHQQVVNRLPNGLVTDRCNEWSGTLTALQQLKTERNNLIHEQVELREKVNDWLQSIEKVGKSQLLGWPSTIKEEDLKALEDGAVSEQSKRIVQSLIDLLKSIQNGAVHDILNEIKSLNPLPPLDSEGIMEQNCSSQSVPSCTRSIGII